MHMKKKRDNLLTKETILFFYMPVDEWVIQLYITEVKKDARGKSTVYVDVQVCQGGDLKSYGTASLATGARYAATVYGCPIACGLTAGASKRITTGTAHAIWS